MLDLIKNKNSKKEAAKRRGEITRKMTELSPNIKNSTITTISNSDLKLLFELYDRCFFKNVFRDSFKGKFKFSLSRRMTKSAGKTICPKNIDEINPEELVIEIRIGVDFFFQYGVVDGSKTVCGIKTQNSLEALQLIFEHEMCHVLEYLCFGKSNCSGERFKVIAGNFFGHSESYHKLPTYRQIAKQKLGLNIGDKVSFTFEGKKMSGILYNINKRATVMVRDKNGQYSDKKDTRYTKYYVPLSQFD